MQKVLRETQTLCAGCSKTEPKIFTPPQTPFPEARDGQNLISWRRSLPLPKDPVWWGSMHAISSYHSNRPTNTHTHAARPLQTRTQTGPMTIHCAAKLSMQCNELNCELETKASSHQGQCIPAGSSVSPPRMVLITTSLITMRSIFRKLCVRCLRFTKFPPQFSNLVAPSTHGSANCLLRYKVHRVP